MPQYAIFLYADFDRPSSDVQPGEREEHEAFSDELMSEGNMRAAIVLEDVTTATSLRADVISDGPFVEAKEAIAGLFILDADDLDEAIATARRNPILLQGGGLEIRPISGFGVWPKDYDGAPFRW
ncbi:MAG: YciI family protein [Acidimicrobiales bacterium]